MEDKERLYSVFSTSIILVLFFILVLTTASASTERNVPLTVNETQITTNGLMQYSHAISGTGQFGQIGAMAIMKIHRIPISTCTISPIMRELR